MKNYTMKVDKVFNTDGDGFWSNQVKSVFVTYIEVPYINEEFSHGEMRLYFDENTWNVTENGYIYTDRGFLNEVLEYIHEIFGKTVNDINYSERGMQQNNYVSFDVGKDFLRFWVDNAVKNSHLFNNGD